MQDEHQRGGVETVVATLNAGLVDSGIPSEVLSWLPRREGLVGAGAGGWFWSKVSGARERAAAARRCAERLKRDLAADPGLVVLLEPGSLEVARRLQGSPRWGVHVHWNPDLLLRPWRHLVAESIPTTLLPVALLRAWLQGQSQRRTVASAPFLVTLTPSHSDELRALNPRLHEIGNPLVVPHVSLPDRSRPAADNPVVVSYVGRLSWEKGPDVLVDAVDLLGELGALVQIAGTGPALDDITARIDHLSRRTPVQMLGWVAAEDVLTRSHVLVLPSRVEAAPLVLAEALAAGCLVVATDAGGGVRDLLAQGRLGRIVPVEDPRALADAIEAAIRDVREGTKPDPKDLAGILVRHEPYRVLAKWVELGRSVIG